MTKPSHDFSHCPHHCPRGQGRAVDHDHRQTQFARSLQLGFGPSTARILGYEMADAMASQQIQIALHIKRPARQNNGAIGQGRGLWRIDQPQQEMVRPRGKTRNILLANRQKYPRWPVGQGSNSARNIINMQPPVASLRAPFRPLQPNQWHARNHTSLYCVPAHLGGKGMCGIDHSADRLRAQIIDQPSHTTKPANPRWQGLRHGGIRASGIRENGIGFSRSQCTGKRAGLAGAAKDKAARHV